MSKLKLGTWVSSPKGKIVTGKYLEHKKDGSSGDVSHIVDRIKSKHVLDLRKAKTKALKK